MSRGRTVEEKVGDWLTAYRAVQAELTPEAFRVLTSLAKDKQDEDETFNLTAINIGMTAARVVFANDRAAATVAALITQTGIKPTGFDYGDDPE
jgi:uncharacterized glyoxalase superfamily metalloenzyme YdcJ